MSFERGEARARALERELDQPLARSRLAAFAGAEVAVVAPPDPEILHGLIPLLQRLRNGPRRGRVELVVSAPDGTAAPRDVAASVERAIPGLRVHIHDPDRSTWFHLRFHGQDVAIDDVLRESEAIVLADVTNSPECFWRLVVPGLAAPEVRSTGLHPPDLSYLYSIDLIVGFWAKNPDHADVSRFEILFHGPQS